MAGYRHAWRHMVEYFLQDLSAWRTPQQVASHVDNRTLASVRRMLALWATDGICERKEVGVQGNLKVLYRLTLKGLPREGN